MTLTAPCQRLFDRLHAAFPSDTFLTAKPCQKNVLGFTQHAFEPVNALDHLATRRWWGWDRKNIEAGLSHVLAVAAGVSLNCAVYNGQVYAAPDFVPMPVPTGIDRHRNAVHYDFLPLSEGVPAGCAA